MERALLRNCGEGQVKFHPYKKRKGGRKKSFIHAEKVSKGGAKSLTLSCREGKTFSEPRFFHFVLISSMCLISHIQYTAYTYKWCLIFAINHNRHVHLIIYIPVVIMLGPRSA